MTWLFILLAMAVVALVAGVATGRISGGLDAPESSSPFQGLPAEPVVPGDVATLRFTPVLRGYRMDEVDEVLDRLAQELHRRDVEIFRLRAVLRGEDPDSDGTQDSAAADPVGTVDDPDERATDERATDERATDERATDERATDERATDGGATGGGTADGELSSDAPRGRF